MKLSRRWGTRLRGGGEVEGEVLCGFASWLLFLPLGYLLEGLRERAEDHVGAAVAEAFDGLVEVVGGVPEADADAVGGQVGADALTEGTRVRKGKWREGRDEDHGFGLFGEGVEELGGEGGAGEQEG